MFPEKPFHAHSTAAALWGSELRWYRQAAGLGQDELGKHLYCSRQLVGAMENGERVPEVDRVRTCDQVLDTGGALYRLMQKFKLDVFPGWFRDWPEVEAKSLIIRGYEAMVVPGLLQTDAYARALLGDEDAVRARLDRQAILTREEDPDPPTLRVIIDEAVLYREVGGPEVMREQLEHLAAIDSSRISVQIAPSGVHAGLSGNFYIATLEDGENVGYVDTAARGIVLERPADIAVMAEAFESLRDHAYSVRQSRELLKKAARRWTSATPPGGPAPAAPITAEPAWRSPASTDPDHPHPNGKAP